METLKILATGFFLFSLWSCGPKYVVGHQTPGVDSRLLERIAVLPVVVETATDRPGQTLKTGIVEEGGPLIITALLYENLKGYHGLAVLPRIEVDQVVERVTAEQSGLSLTEQARQVGEALDVQTVLVGRVNIFVEREGGAYGIKRPASAGFELFLISVKDGAVLWKGSYYETQQSLFSDITTFSLFMKRKGRWQTATELAMYGVGELLDTSPWATSN